MLPSFSKLQITCHKVSPNLHCINNGGSVTITGSWRHVEKARKIIQLLITETITDTVDQPTDRATPPLGLC